ncbi:hypothetical protein BaRGS_00028844 [Batillaria attramentaria]|uniref:Uncharacterized protein n=1 Tax=Batillaria attramentaria TaxID=370345 RepID=A0ABD0JYT8_9CAEN
MKDTPRKYCFPLSVTSFALGESRGGNSYRQASASIPRPSAFSLICQPRFRSWLFFLGAALSSGQGARQCRPTNAREDLRRCCLSRFNSNAAKDRINTLRTRCDYYTLAEFRL